MRTGQYNGCADAPEKILFDNLPASLSDTPPPTTFSLQGLNFTVTSSDGFSDIAATTAPKYVSSPPTAILATFGYGRGGFVTGTLQIQDTNAAAGGQFVAISGFVSASPFADESPSTVSPVSGSVNGIANPLCQFMLETYNDTVEFFYPYGPATLPLNGAGRSCVIDTLSIPVSASGANVLVSLDDFVVCKANQLSGLLPN